MNITTVISTAFDTVKRRITKVRRRGKDDVQTAIEIAPYGCDSNPIAGMRAIYSPTEDKGKKVIIGYINKDQLAEVGEHRLYSTDSNGVLKFFIWLKNDGTLEIGGNSDNAVRYSPLNTGLQQFKSDIQAQLALIATGIAAGGGSYTPGTLTLDISNSKIQQIKTL